MNSAAHATAARKYKKRMPKTKERPCGDGSLSLADLHIDALEHIANQLDTEHFISLYLALPKGLWTAEVLLERRLMRQPDIILFDRAAKMYSFLGTIQPHYLNRLCYKTYMRLCSNPIHSADRINLFRTMMADHTKLFNTPGSIRQAKADFKQFDHVRRSTYLSKALEHTWMQTYKTCGGLMNAAKLIVEHLNRDAKNPILFGSQKLTFIQVMCNALIKNKKLTTLLINLSSWRIPSDISLCMNQEHRKNYQLLRNNITNRLKAKYGEFELFLKLILILKHPWSSYFNSSSIYAFRPYEIVFDPLDINHNRREYDIKLLEFKFSIEKINQRWCEYLSVEHIPNDYSVERITTLWRLTREKFAATQ